VEPHRLATSFATDITHYQTIDALLSSTALLPKCFNKSKQRCFSIFACGFPIYFFRQFSEEEYRKYLAPGLTKKLVDIRDADMTDLDTENMPDSVDWRKQGAVTAVKNQVH